jgi:hypothetical protein
MKGPRRLWFIHNLKSGGGTAGVDTNDWPGDRHAQGAIYVPATNWEILGCANPYYRPGEE